MCGGSGYLDWLISEPYSGSVLNQLLILAPIFQDIKSDIVCYQKPSPDLPKGFQAFASLPPTRELLLRNKDKPEEMWRVWNQET